MKPRLFLLIGVLLLLVLTILPVSAQTTVTYGTVLTAQLSADAPQAFYTFTGSAGDLVTVYVLGHNSDFSPTVSLSGSAGQLAFDDNDLLTPMRSDASLTVRLPQDGVYSVLVGNANVAPGVYTFSLQVAAPTVTTVLNDAVTIDIPAGAPAQSYTISANENAARSLMIQSETPDFDFSTTLRNPNGEIIAVITGGVDAATFTIPAGTGEYEVSVTAADSTLGGRVTLSLDGAASDSVPSPATTEEATAPITDPNACTITTSGNVNVRTGPGTDFEANNSLDPNEQFIATGQNDGWYYGSLNGRTGWVFSGVVAATGACGNLSFVQAPAAPAPQTTEEVPAPQVTEDVPAPQATEDVDDDDDDVDDDDVDDDDDSDNSGRDDDDDDGT